jgi:HD-like signal output (HDOD) protein
MELMEQPARLEVNPVAAMVQGDPAVIARLLQIANSAYYGLPRTVESAERAIILLGPVTVTGVVMGMNIVQLQSVLDDTAARCFMSLIRHSVATAFLTRHFIEGPPRFNTGSANRYKGRIGSSFTAGLLHDFGKIIFVYNFPALAVNLYEKKLHDGGDTTADIRKQEQQVFGCDHTEAGALVAKKLGFPELLLEVIRHHHEPEKITGGPEAVRLAHATNAANLCATVAGYGFFEEMTWDQCRTDPRWHGLLKQASNRYRTFDELVEDVVGIQNHLDEYVGTLMAASRVTEEPDGSEPNPRVYYHS